MNAPVKPTMVAKMSSAPRFSSRPPMLKLMPKTALTIDNVMPSTTMIARFVRTNSAIRFMVSPE